MKMARRKSKMTVIIGQKNAVRSGSAVLGRRMVERFRAARIIEKSICAAMLGGWLIRDSFGASTWK
jgi:hypothetical protein